MHMFEHLFSSVLYSFKNCGLFKNLSVMSEGLTSAASESTMRLMSGSVTEN